MHHEHSVQTATRQVVAVSLLLLCITGTATAQPDHVFHVDISHTEAIPMTRGSTLTITNVSVGTPVNGTGVTMGEGPFMLRATAENGENIALQQFDLPERRDGVTQQDPIKKTVTVPYSADVDQIKVYYDGYQRDETRIQPLLCSIETDGHCSPYCDARGVDPDCDTRPIVIYVILALVIFTLTGTLAIYRTFSRISHGEKNT